MFDKTFHILCRKTWFVARTYLAKQGWVQVILYQGLVLYYVTYFVSIFNLLLSLTCLVTKLSYFVLLGLFISHKKLILCNKTVCKYFHLFSRWYKTSGWYKLSGCSIYLFGVLHRFQHCTGHITTGSWKGRGNQYIQFVRVLYCKLPTNRKQLPAFPLEAVPGIEPLPLCHHGP